MKLIVDTWKTLAHREEFAVAQKSRHTAGDVCLKSSHNRRTHRRRLFTWMSMSLDTLRIREIIQSEKLECVPKFCYFGDTLGAGGVEEAARARVISAWAKFKELSHILTAQGASYRIKGKIYKTCVQSVLCIGIWK